VIGCCQVPGKEVDQSVCNPESRHMVVMWHGHIFRIFPLGGCDWMLPGPWVGGGPISVQPGVAAHGGDVARAHGGDAWLMYVNAALIYTTRVVIIWSSPCLALGFRVLGFRV
jgi:hypothetical protein